MALRYRQEKSLERRTDHAATVTLWVRTMLNADEDTVVSVTGNQCGDTGCSGVETIILLMRRDQPTEAIKISKSLETVVRSDVAEALRPLVFARRPIRGHRTAC